VGISKREKKNLLAQEEGGNAIFRRLIMGKRGDLIASEESAIGR